MPSICFSQSIENLGKQGFKGNAKARQNSAQKFFENFLKISLTMPKGYAKIILIKMREITK